MTDNRCRTCGFFVVSGGHLQDQEAQEHGFCSFGCRQVADKVNEFNERALRQEGR